MFIDVTPGERSANIDLVRSSMSQALALAGRGVHTPQPGQRFDAAGMLGNFDTLDAWQSHIDGESMRRLSERNVTTLSPAMMDLARRSDALPAGVAGFPRDFEYIRARALEQVRQPLNGFRLFPMDTEVPLGARSHTTRREVGSGEAKIYRGGKDYGTAKVGHVEETFGVVYVTCAVEMHFFEMLTSDWAGLNQYSKDLRQAVRLVEERLNRIIFNGDVPSKIYGVLNYPHLAKQVMGTVFADTTDGEDLVKALHRLADTPLLQSGAAMQGNRMVTSPRIHRLLHNMKHSTTGGTDTTVAEYFLKGQDAATGIRTIDMAQEYAGIGPLGEDGIFVYRDEVDTIANVMIQPPTTLPIFQSTPLDQQTVVFAATGGMTMGDVGNSILGLAATS